MTTESRDSSVGTATRLRTRRSGDRISVGARFSEPVQIGPGTHPASCAMGNVTSPLVKRLGLGVDHLPLSIAKVKERVKLYNSTPSRGHTWRVLA